MSVVIGDSRRKPFSKYPPPAEEVAALNTFTAYAGTYTYSGDKVTHHIEVSSFQDVVNADQVRSVKIQGDRLTLRGGWLGDGVMYNQGSELVWERMKPNTTDK